MKSFEIIKEGKRKINNKFKINKLFLYFFENIFQLFFKS